MYFEQSQVKSIKQNGPFLYDSRSQDGTIASKAWIQMKRTQYWPQKDIRCLMEILILPQKIWEEILLSLE